MNQQENTENFINPIDKDKVAENPGLLPYAHTVSGPVIKPEDKAQIRGLAVTAMRQQTDMQMEQIYKQMELLAEQAKQLHQRKKISELIYEANIGFQPIINKVYHVYRKQDDTTILSIIAPNEWRGKMPYAAFIATVRLLADHTWDIMEGGNF